MLQRVTGSGMMSLLDGFSGYNQVWVKKEDRHKTTFTTPWGTFEYIRMPFGLTTVGATFQRAMDYDFKVITQRGAEGVLAGGSSPEPRILSREAKRHTEKAAQRPERVMQSQEGLTQAPRKATRKSKYDEEADVSDPRGMEKASEGKSILS
eukprot:PITA_20175